MSGAERAAGAENMPQNCRTAERNGSGRQRNKADGMGLQKNCRKTAEQLQNLSSVSDLASILPTLSRLADALALVQLPTPKMPREINPAEAPKRRGDVGPGDAGVHTLAKRGRAWAVHDPAGELVALVLYRKGAAEVVRRLDASAGHAADSAIRC